MTALNMEVQCPFTKLIIIKEFFDTVFLGLERQYKKQILQILFFKFLKHCYQFTWIKIFLREISKREEQCIVPGISMLIFLYQVN